MSALRIPKLFAFACLGLVACDKNDEPIPGYLLQDSYKFNYTVPQSTGGVEITDTWLFVDDNNVGVLEVPYEVAIQSGERKLEFRAGVKVSGRSAVRMAYPFYRPFRPNFNYQFYPDSNIYVEPTYQYVDDLIFPWFEDFEDGIFSLIPAVGSDTVNYRIETSTNDPNYLGGFVCYAATDKDHPRLRLASEKSWFLPTNGVPVFMEIDYKTTKPFFVRIAYDLPDQAPDELNVLGVNPTGETLEDAEWRKIYIELDRELATISTSPTFGIIIQADHGDSDTTGQFLFDNIKIVYQ